MSLFGKAVVAIWNDITAEGRANFIEWHNREHIPERVAIHGTHRGRRYLAEAGAPEYFTLYEAHDTGVLVGDAYLERPQQSHGMDQGIDRARFRNTLRGGYVPPSIPKRSGEGVLHADAALPDADPARAQALQDVPARSGTAAAWVDLTGICGVHLCISPIRPQAAWRPLSARVAASTCRTGS